MPPNTVKVARPTQWGNPFIIANCLEAGFARDTAEARQLCVEAFKDWLERGELSDWWFEGCREKWERMRRDLDTLRGRNLACFCRLDDPCHADVLIELANRC